FSVDHHPALGSEIAGEQDVPIATGDRGSRSQKYGRNGKSAFAAIPGVNVIAAGGVVEFRLRGADENRLMYLFAVIDLGSRQLQIRDADHGRRIADIEYRQTIWVDTIRLRHNDPVSVRVDEVRIDPAAAGISQGIKIQLARRDENLP